MLKLGSVVLGVSDVPREEIQDAWAVPAPAQGTGVPLSLGLGESPVQHRPRIHPDLCAGDAADQAAEVERLVSLGAQRVDRDLCPADADFAVLADPDGNRFCVIDTGRR